MQAKGEGLKAKDAKYNLTFYFRPLHSIHTPIALIKLKQAKG